MDGSFGILSGLVRLALGTGGTADVPSDFNGWESLCGFSFNQGLAYVAADGLKILVKQNPDVVRPENTDDLLQWMVNAYNAETEYHKFETVLSDLCRLLNEHDIPRVLLLKGLGLSRYYPIPCHRHCGDIDIYTYGSHGEVDEVMRELGIKVDAETNEKHSVFSFRGVVVENHHCYIDKFRSRNEAAINSYLDFLGGDELTPDGYYIPSPEKNFFFLLSHIQRHFSGAKSITLRQILDWALFLKGEEERLDAGYLKEKVREFKLEKFNAYITSIAEDLSGIDFHRFISAEVSPTVKKRFLSDILGEKKIYTGRSLAKRTGLFLERVWKFKYTGISASDYIRDWLVALF